ncbi:MAG: hypothetical protein DRI83_07455 [Bacteroidetes bacterium]|nr:MAG: hypothetical protein DRI83_07455 [Bacteroidota bacterium]
MSRMHTFHIPVLGIGYSADSPLKISQFGMDSVLSLVDDILLEKLRKMYCERNGINYVEISGKAEDYRAKRITAYLDLLKLLTEKKFTEMKKMGSTDPDALNEFFSFLPESSSLWDEFTALFSSGKDNNEILNWLDDNLSMGSIDVNIMTKLDKENYKKGEKLAIEYNDAHAALRGFANSGLESTLVLSAGINPRLYSYMQEFEDFYPDEHGYIKKKIALKVSDFKSALIQGKFLAKKGIWVSEYRIESGLNCGGHAFATDGHLMGPILAEFSSKRDELIRSIHDVLIPALSGKNRTIPETDLSLEITAQGGVGTSEEHQFLIDHYGIDSVGWGTPFLLVPEATTVDEATLGKLCQAKEDDLYLSDISPLGIPFNSLRGNTKDLEKLSHIANGKPGSSCSKKYAALSNEFSDKTLCTASRHYQTLKLKELGKAALSAEEYMDQYKKIVGKACICVGLGTSCMIVHKLDNKIEGDGVSVCPGPNMAYFSSAMSLKDITNHIYGRTNIIQRKDRPNMFIKELEIYLDFLKNKIDEMVDPADEKNRKYFHRFAMNLISGIEYYREMFGTEGVYQDSKFTTLKELDRCQESATQLIEDLEPSLVTSF